jgi:hypothetical protein
MTNVMQAFHLQVIVFAGWLNPYDVLVISRREFSRRCPVASIHAPAGVVQAALTTRRYSRRVNIILFTLPSRRGGVVFVACRLKGGRPAARVRMTHE